ncbi:MAG TPA: hypothetical protein VFR30_07345, partial [Lysobacter sp.]|nr:hypothetical protein [Lysobacter sp.]
PQGEVMHPVDSADYAGPEVEARIHELEQDMPSLYLRHTTVFALASAWAERYDAIMALVSPDMRTAVEARLARIGIRWGVMPGSRITIEFQVSDVTALARARRPPRT